MPIKYVGRTNDFKGNTLWEILGNLKNYGVGRMVIRNRFQRYPEACYYRILKVAALAKPTQFDVERRMVVLVEKTFRGVTEPGQLYASTYKADYVLIPKDEETRFLNSKQPPIKKIFPAKMELPPLLKLFIIEQAKAAGKPFTDEPMMQIQYQRTRKFEVATDEKPATVKMSISLGEPASPSLYANIKDIN